MNILILAESLRINETSSGIVSSTFIKALSLNSRVNHIDVLYQKDFDYPVSWLDDKKIRLIPLQVKVSQSLLKKIPKIRALPAYFTGLSFDMLAQVKNWREQTEQLLNQKKYDLIIALGTGSSFMPHYALLKVKTTIPVLFNFHDPYPMSRFPEPYRKKRNIIYFHQERFVSKMFRQAGALSFPSEYLKDFMLQGTEFREKAFVLPHVGISLENIPSKSEDREVHLPKGKFNLLHAGTLLGPRKVDALFRAFEQLSNEDAEFRESAVLTVLGKVAKEHQNLEKHQGNKQENLRVITKRVSYPKSLELLAQCDMALVVEADADFSPFMPGKLADIFYYEKPVLALTPERSEVRRILGKNYPYVARVYDAGTIYHILKQAWKAWKSGALKNPDAGRLKKYVSAEDFNKRFDEIFAFLTR